jgi:outer membrane protein
MSGRTKAVRNYFVFMETGKMRKYIIFIILLTAASLAASPEEDRKVLIMDLNGVKESDITIAESKNELYLYDLFILALKKNEGIAIEGEKSLQTLARRDQAIGAFLPRISVRGVRAIPENDKNSQTTGIALYARLNIFFGLSEYAGYKSAGYEMKMRKCRLLYYSGQLLLESAVNFYSVIQLEVGIKNREQVLKYYRNIAAELRRRASLGKTRGSDVLLAEGQIQRIEAEILSLKNELHRARLSLQTLAGVNHDIILKDNSLLSNPVYDLETAKKNISARPDIRAAEYEVSMAEQNLLEAKGGHLPTAYIEGSYNLYSREKTPKDYNAYLGVELPIFSGGITRGRVKESESLLRQAGLKLSSVKRYSIEEVTDAYASWESSSKEVEAYRAAAGMAERNYNAVLREYRLSLTTILDVFAALKELQGANDDFEKKRLQHVLDRLRLGVASGEFEGGKSAVLKIDKND